MSDGGVKESISMEKLMSKQFTNVMTKSWTPQSEVWSFVYGSELLGTMSAINSIFIMHSIRKQLNLRPYARLTCYTPVTGLAAFLAEGLHSNYINKQILGFESCPLCIVAKAGIIQAAVSIAYPLILSPIIGFYISDKLLTYPVPSIHRAPKELFQLFCRLTTKNPRFILFSLTIQTFAASIVTSEKQSFLCNFISKKNATLVD